MKGKIIPMLPFRGDPLVLCPAGFYFENKLEKSFRGKTLEYKAFGTFQFEREVKLYLPLNNKVYFFLFKYL